MPVNPDLFNTTVSSSVPPDDPDQLQATFIETPLAQSSGFSGYSGFSGTNPGQSGYSGYSGQMGLGATWQSSLGNPTGTTSPTGVMMGLANPIKPVSSGTVEVVCSFELSNNTVGSVAVAELAYGVGSAPLNGQPMPGGWSFVGNAAFFIQFGAGNNVDNACISALVSGLTPGTQYWFDLLLFTNFGGTATVQNVSTLIHEIGSGPPGATGPQGVSGYSGRSGYSGISGFSGQTSTSGYSGQSGFSGYSAVSGISGFSGQSGQSGFSGMGTSGFSGYSGQSGQPGTFSASGYSGYSGQSGYSGLSGYSAASPGASGFSGFSGPAGTSGFSGPSGVSGYSGFMGTGNTSYSLPVDPAVTASTTGVMMGLAGSFTPVGSGVAEIIVCGDISNNTNGNGAQVQIRYGIGSAPANAAALTGTTLGGLAKYVPDATSSIRNPFAVSGVVNLTAGTTYWIDVGLAAIGGGQARIQDVSISAFEIGAGRSGVSGYSGFSGSLPGASGYSGFSGYSSISGFSGYSGSGLSGYSGPSGVSGFSGSFPLTGITNGSNAAAGNVGEYISASIAAPGTAITSGVVKNLTSIALTAGDWELFGFGGCLGAGGPATTLSEFYTAFSVNNNDIPNDPSALWNGASFNLGSFYMSFAIPVYRVNITSPTTYYLNVQATFGANTMTCFGRISARRMR